MTPRRSDYSTLPAVVITREECDRVVDVLEHCFNKLGEEIGTVGRKIPVA